MSGVLGSPVNILLEGEQAARSIVVSNISPQTTKEGVIIHFQKRKNGGGDIDRIYIQKNGTAVVTFDEREGLCILCLL